MNIGGGSGAVLGTASGISNLASSLAARLGGTATSYFDQLYQASFRSVEFVSLGGISTFGRRVAIHEYPKQDKPWPEDMGRKTRHFTVFGYLVGDDVISRRDALIAAAELSGVGTLVHATFGELDVSLLDMRVVEQWDKGRYFEIEFDFVEWGQKVFPSTGAATGSALTASILGVNVATAANFAARVLNTVSLGAAVVESAVSTALGWYTAAKNVVVDARNLFSLLTDLPGDFGLFAGAARISAFSTNTTSGSSSTATVTSLTAASVANRSAVDVAGTALSTATSDLSTTNAADVSNAAVAVVDAVLNATADPSDGIRLLTSLASYVPTTVNTTSTIGTAITAMQGACSDLFRRSCIAAVAQAGSQYTPTSSDDAYTVRDQITALIDAEIAIAGDQAEDETLEAMISLRAAVIADLNARGASLPGMKTFRFQASLPAVVLANRIYRDSTRADELVLMADAPHPLFMPTTFKALST